MSESSYTPGPYFYALDRDGVDDMWAIRARNDEKTWIAEIRFWDNGDGFKALKYEANARLLAAAPSLLEELKAMLAFVTSLPEELCKARYWTTVINAKGLIDAVENPYHVDGDE